MDKKINSKPFDHFCWHDGVLVDISFKINQKGNSSVLITGYFYKDDQDPCRKAYQISCKKVSRFNSTLDAIELKDNRVAGNIANGYQKGNTLWLYFTDGILEIHAKKFYLVEC